MSALKTNLEKQMHEKHQAGLKEAVAKLETEAERLETVGRPLLAKEVRTKAERIKRRYLREAEAATK